MSNTRKTRLRLTFNFRTKEVEKEKIRTFATTIVSNVAINAADEMWSEVRSKIASRLEADVHAEITKMAQLYKQYIIGISGSNWGAKGILTPASKFAEGSTYSDLTYDLASGPTGDWAPRGQAGIAHRKKRLGDYYLPWKQRKVGHQRWFEHSGMLNSVMGAGKNWETWFGPVRVIVSRIEDSVSPADFEREANSQMTATAQATYRDKFDIGTKYDDTGNVMRVQVARIYVEAMRNITPRMLPALLSGDINDVPRDNRGDGMLIGLLPPQIAQHVAGSSKPENFVPYRHTLEPFLGFALTRAIPNAVMRRIEDGLSERIRFDRMTGDKKGAKQINPLGPEHSESFKG